MSENITPRKWGKPNKATNLKIEDTADLPEIENATPRQELKEDIENEAVDELAALRKKKQIEYAPFRMKKHVLQAFDKIRKKEEIRFPGTLIHYELEKIAKTYYEKHGLKPEKWMEE
ncbi:hypothetical protein [Xanthovirga aplysinae]|uniref:hypothetical protein n=1 Tax=Xanthovirga aplysinae TaxID=2529853 RepID=UPI0012BC5D33|nr:hypothetical protein [Xanthovirga aplysinae]MTI31349.1 hypothetical protein [Xanthovirga aplysinae]